MNITNLYQTVILMLGKAAQDGANIEERLKAAVYPL